MYYVLGAQTLVLGVACSWIAGALDRSCKWAVSSPSWQVAHLGDE